MYYILDYIIYYILYIIYMGTVRYHSLNTLATATCCNSIYFNAMPQQLFFFCWFALGAKTKGK